MTRPTCAAPIAPGLLLPYWLRELSEPEEARIEEHVLACDDCSAALQSLVDLGEGVRACVRGGLVQAVVTDIFVWRLAARGLRVREYRVPRNGSVHCTIAPQDDVAIARLEAPLAGVERLDVLVFASPSEPPEVLEDVPFDPAAGEVVFAPNIAFLRSLPASTMRIQVVAMEQNRPHALGEYTFIHTPWGGA